MRRRSINTWPRSPLPIATSTAHPECVLSPIPIRTKCPVRNGLNKSILDLLRRTESGTCPDSALADQRLASSSWRLTTLRRLSVPAPPRRRRDVSLDLHRPQVHDVRGDSRFAQ